MGAQQKSVIERVCGCVCGKESVCAWVRVWEGERACVGACFEEL